MLTPALLCWCCAVVVYDHLHPPLSITKLLMKVYWIHLVPLMVLWQHCSGVSLIHLHVCWCASTIVEFCIIDLHVFAFPAWWCSVLFVHNFGRFIWMTRTDKSFKLMKVMMFVVHVFNASVQYVISLLLSFYVVLSISVLKCEPVYCHLYPTPLPHFVNA